MVSYVNIMKFSCCDIYPRFCESSHNCMCTYVCTNVISVLPTIGTYIVCACLYFVICTSISTVVVSEPDVTICEGREAVFTCVLNSSIRSDDVQWYRFIKDTSAIEMVVNSNKDNINIITDTIGSTTSSSLTITNVIKSYTGYFWVGTPSHNICNASLTVLTSRVNCSNNSCATLIHAQTRMFR